jgi:hypothetical protein
MARGKQTDPTVAVVAKVMHEMGFESGLIATVTGLCRGTVNDIIRGHGPWYQIPRSELLDATRMRVKSAIENVANELAMKTIARLEQSLKKTSFMEAVQAVDVLSRLRR